MTGTGTRTTFARNLAGANGGAMLFRVAAPVSIADSAFVSNTALAGEGGAIWALYSVPLIRARLDCVGPVISADYNLFAIAPGCAIGAPGGLRVFVPTTIRGE